MKTIQIIILLWGVFHLSLEAQDNKPALSISEVSIEDDNYAAKSVVSKLTTRLKKDFTIIPQGVINLSATASFGEMHTINGMDTYTTTETDISYTISGENLPSKNMDLSLKSKGKNERDLKRKLGTSIIRDSKHIDALNTFIQEYIKENLGTCAQITSIIDAQLANNEIAKANGMIGYYDHIGSCETEKSKAEQAVEDQHVKYACDSAIQQATVLSNSGDIKDLNAAIDLLQIIPPDAPCAKEAISISEQVGKNAIELSKHSSAKLQDRITVMNTLSHSDWKHWYRKNYTKIYR